MDDDRPPICPACGVTMVPADLSALGRDDIFTLSHEYVSVTSIGTVGNVNSQISCIFKLGEKEPVPLFWAEGKQKE